MIQTCSKFFSSPYQPTLAAWRTVFLITAGLYLVCNTLFVFLMVAEVQPWAVVKPDIVKEVSGPAVKAEPSDKDAKGS